MIKSYSQRHSQALERGSADFIRQPAYCSSSSCRASIHDSYKVFIAPIQVQNQIPVAGLPCWTVASVLWLAKFFISGQFHYSVIPLFCYSVFHILPIEGRGEHWDSPPPPNKKLLWCHNCLNSYTKYSISIGLLLNPTIFVLNMSNISLQSTKPQLVHWCMHTHAFPLDAQVLVSLNSWNENHAWCHPLMQI